MNLIIYDNPAECTYPKYVALFDGSEEHSARVEHKGELTIAAAYGSVGHMITTCGEIYTVPFAKGDLRVISFLDSQNKRCFTQFAAMVDGKNWEPLKNIRKRTLSMPNATAGDGHGFCRKEGE